MLNGDKFESEISAVNVSYFMPNEKREELKKALSNHEINMLFREQRHDSVQASLFQTIVLYINEHLTELFICGLLAPAAYDIVKTTILYIAKSISKLIQKPGKDETYPSMKLNIGNAEIIAPIPTNLNEEQFTSYMDTLKSSLKTLSDNEVRKTERYNMFIVEYSNETEKICVKTVSQYGMERAKEQQKSKEENHD